MTHIGRDLLHGWRRLLASPGFVIFAITSLALGIGATTAIYAVIHAVLAPPAGIHGVDEIVNVSHTRVGSVPIVGISLPDFEDFRARQQTLHNVSARGQMRQTLAAQGQSYSAVGEIVSGDYFVLLGVKAAAGRLLQPADDNPTAPPVCVLSYRAWQSLFSGREDALGAPVKVNGHTFTVAGVATREFKGQWANGLVPAAAWVPLSSAGLFTELGSAEDLRGREHRWLFVQGRLPPATPIEQVRSEVATIAGQLDLESPIGGGTASTTERSFRNSRPWTLSRPADVVAADPFIGPLVTAVLGVLALVLLIACTNLANLMVARVSLRRHELAVRRALGASRSRLIAEGLTEALILSAAGGLAGVGIARVLTTALRREFNIGVASVQLDPTVDLPVLAFCLGATVLALLVAGLVPAWLSARAGVRAALAFGSAQSAGPRWRGRRFLIAGQVAVSVALLAIATLFISQVRTQVRLASGLDLDRIAVAEVDFKMQNVDEARTRQIVSAVTERLARHAGVESVAASSGLPVGMTTPGGGLKRSDGGWIGCSYVASTPDIFRTLGVSIVSGRVFDLPDAIGSEPVVVINETAGRALFGEAAAVGQYVTVMRRVWVGEDKQPEQVRRVIGVASDSDSGDVGRRSEGVIYLPLAQQLERRLVFSVRAATGRPDDIVGDLRQTIVAVAPDVGITQIGTGLAIAGPSTAFAQVTAGVAGTLGTFGLILALAGLYGVLSHVVSRRTREIGVRLSLGASPGQIQWLMLREGLSPVMLGVVLGTALALLTRFSLQPQFVRMLPGLDIFALAILPLLLLAAGALASIIPARRAARVDPNVALRDL